MADVAREALRTLADALREAQAAVVQMREDAAKIADGVLDGPLPAGAFAIAVRISKAIRSLPAPAARTYDDGVRDAAKAVRSVETRIVHQRQEPITESDVLQIARDRSEACAAAVERLLSPAPAVAPVAQKHDPAPRPLHYADCAHDSTPEVSVPHMPPERTQECHDCDGKGGFDGYGKPINHPSARRACETCDGTGRVAPVAAPIEKPDAPPEPIVGAHGPKPRPDDPTMCAHCERSVVVRDGWVRHGITSALGPLPDAPVAALKPGPTKIVNEVGRVPFDAEAALVAAREAARTGIDRNPTVEARQIAHLLHRMLSDAIAAGRGAR